MSKNEKVKLTRPQAAAIERIKSNSVQFNIEKHESKSWRDLSGLNDLSTEELALALFIGYEIKEEFKVGDWVVYFNGEPHGNKTNKIELIEDGSAYFDEYRRRSMLLDSLRHATPEEIAEEKERRWWAKHSRDVWELKTGDCLISNTDPHTCNVKFVESVDSETTLLVDGIEDEFYEGNHDLLIMRDKYKVFCFAESRLDLQEM